MQRLCDPELPFRLVSVFEDVRDKMDGQAVFPRPYHALSCRLEGSGTVLETENEKVTLGAASLLYMPADTPYRIHAGAERLIIIHFDVSAPISKELAVLDHLPPSLCETFVTLHRVWREKAPGYGLRAMSLFYAILEQVHRLSADSPAYRRLQPALEQVHQHFDDPSLTVSRLALTVGLGETRFRHLFCEVTGSTPLQYLNRLRVDRAADLLANGLLRIEDIALRCGFTDPKYFSVVFRKYKGVAPSVYAKRPLSR